MTGLHSTRMAITDYCRSTGHRLTYRITTDAWGRYSVHLGDRELLRGQDPLCAHGRHRSPNKRKAQGALQQAKMAIEMLRDMPEF